MNSIRTLATFFGWCTILSLGFLVVSILAWALVGDGVSEVAASLMGITEQQIKLGFFNGLMVYRSGIFLLNLVPYIALKIMSRGQASANP